jgi:nuclear cap-binding protein subunit 1
MDTCLPFFLSRYLSFLVGINSNPLSRAQTVKVVSNFWRYNEQFLVILLDKLIAYRILDNSTVINWLFTDIIPRENYILLPWEILGNILAKITGRTRQIHLRTTREEAEHKKREEERARERKFHPNGVESSEREKLMDIERQTEIERLEALNNNLNYALHEEKETFVLVFRLFIEVLGSRLPSSNSPSDYHYSWFRWTLGFFREFTRKYSCDLRRLMVTLETLLFTPHLDSRILAVFQELRVMDTI